MSSTCKDPSTVVLYYCEPSISQDTDALIAAERPSEYPDKFVKVSVLQFQVLS